MRARTGQRSRLACMRCCTAAGVTASARGRSHASDQTRMRAHATRDQTRMRAIKHAINTRDQTRKRAIKHAINMRAIKHPCEQSNTRSNIQHTDQTRNQHTDQTRMRLMQIKHSDRDTANECSRESRGRVFDRMALTSRYCSATTLTDTRCTYAQHNAIRSGDR